MYRRRFLHYMPLLTGIPFALRTDIWNDNQLNDDFHDAIMQRATSDQDFWEEIRQAFQKSDITDFNSAGLSMTNREVNLLHSESATDFNKAPSKKVNVYRRDRKEAKAALAKLTGIDASEIAICRNATEALETAIFGIPLDSGDQVVVGLYDYPHVYFAWQQRAKRDGIVLKYVDPGVAPTSPDDIRSAYLSEVTDKTRAICITDLVNWNGCCYPTESILNALPDHVKYRIVDAAQSLGNTRDHWSGLQATHIGASLHKWIGAPVGTGIFYVKKEFISDTWPLFASFSPDEDVIDKFEHVGTWDTTLYSGISRAVNFHLAIGHDRKLKRFTKLSDRLRDGIGALNNWNVVSPRHDKLKSNLILLLHNRLSPKEVHARLWKDHRIHCTTSDWEGIVGVRVSPNVFTGINDVDQLLETLAQIK